MLNVYLLLGSNLGDRFLFLNNAIGLIEKRIAPVAKASSVYETQSWGKTNAPDYLNQVILIETAMPAREVLENILEIELDMGRKREEKWGDRVIDIDILFYGTAVINEPGLQIPHPEFHNRRFTLEPLSELSPGFIPPGFKEDILQLKNGLRDGLIVKKL